MSGLKRKRYFANCLDVAKNDPLWCRLVIAEWANKTEAQKDANSMTRMSVRLLRLAMRRVHGESL